MDRVVAKAYLLVEAIKLRNRSLHRQETGISPLDELLERDNNPFHGTKDAAASSCD